MSLPTTSSKTSQPSIRSFLRSDVPKYASPPSSKTTPGLGPASTEVATSRISTSQAISPNATHPSLATATTQSTITAGVTVTPRSERYIPALPSHLPSEATLRPLEKGDILPLKRLNALLLPVAYQEPFYTHAVDAPFCRVITWQHANSEPKVVGAVVCRLEPQPAPIMEGEQTLYIQSLCLLSPYRGFGLVNAALENIEGEAMADRNVNVRTATAHVWTENEDGLKWYDNRGFKRIGAPIPGYYAKLRPGSAYLVSKDVRASVRAALAATSQVSAYRNLEKQQGTAEVKGQEDDSKRPAAPPQGQSYQNQKADMEWNDLPADMAPGLKAIRKGSEPGSSASSRSSSAARKKRDRSYPAAAFGAS